MPGTCVVGCGFWVVQCAGGLMSRVWFSGRGFCLGVAAWCVWGLLDSEISCGVL